MIWLFFGAVGKAKHLFLVDSNHHRQPLSPLALSEGQRQNTLRLAFTVCHRLQRFAYTARRIRQPQLRFPCAVAILVYPDGRRQRIASLPYAQTLGLVGGLLYPLEVRLSAVFVSYVSCLQSLLRLSGRSSSYPPYSRRTPPVFLCYLSVCCSALTAALSRLSSISFLYHRMRDNPLRV